MKNENEQISEGAIIVGAIIGFSLLAFLIGIAANKSSTKQLIVDERGNLVEQETEE